MQKEIEFLCDIKGDLLSSDPDDTKVSRAFYSKFWKEIIAGEDETFRGDTIISSCRIFGCMIRLLSVYTEGFSIPRLHKERLDIICKSEDVSKEVKDIFRRFYEINHTLANFMPLIREEKSLNLNLIKNSAYRDFPDGFFESVKNFYVCKDGEDTNPVFSKGANLDYFQKFGAKGGGKTGWVNYVEKNYLQDFFEDNQFEKFIPLTPDRNIRMPYIKTKLTDSEKGECIKQIERFLVNAIRIIERRGIRLSKIANENKE